VKSLEEDFCNKMFEHDLQTIFNFSMGAQLSQEGLPCVLMYCKAADYVYRRLKQNAKYLNVELKATSLTRRALSRHEAEFFNFLESCFKYVQVCGMGSG